ncbi:MAG TPA: histidine phosphatase family protein [Candidatus Limnocylindrales bacterium]
MDDPSRARPLTGLSIPPGLDATLVLVRHGESELIAERRFQGRLETPLSPLGRRQADLVARRLADPHARPALPIPARPPLAIVHSPLARAAETAAAIAAAIEERSGSRDHSEGPGAVALRSDDRFVEIGQGDWEGRLASEIAETDGERLAAWRTRPTETWAPGGEPLTDVRARVASGVIQLLADLAAGGTAGSILAPQVAGYRSESVDQPWLVLVGHDGVFKVTLLTLFDLPLERFWMWTSELCGISIVELRAGRPVVRAMNLVEHLAPLLDEATQATTDERQRSGAL